METILIVALIAAFIILLLKKLGVVEYMQVNGNKIVSELFSCDFCMSFWGSVIICFFITCTTNDLRTMLLPFVTTPITRFLL